MAKCKCCHRKGFMIETDVNGLCSDCAPYAQIHMEDDIKLLEQLMRTIERVDYREPVLDSIEQAYMALGRLKPYVKAGLAKLPMPLPELEKWLAEQKTLWQSQS